MAYYAKLYAPNWLVEIGVYGKIERHLSPPMRPATLVDMAEFAWDNRIRGKYMKTRTCKLLLIAMASSMVWMSPDTAYADGSLGGVFDSIRNAVAPQQQSADQRPAGLSPDAPPSQPPAPTLWTTKADFLAAARNGDMIGLNNASEKDLSMVVNSIAAILRGDYGVDLSFLDPQPQYQSNPLSMCPFHFRDVVKRVVRDVTTMRATLSDTPPDFYQAPGYDAGRVDEDVKELGRVDNGYCDLKVLGTVKPNPYQAALLKLMGEYGQASKDYVDAERSRRQTAYADEQKAKSEAQAKADAASKAAEQHRIEADNARLKAEQDKQKAIDANRVGG